MTILDRLRASRVTRRYNTVVRVVSGYVSSLSPEQLYREQPALRAVVSFVSDNLGSLPVKTYTRDGEERRRDRDSVAALLMARPNANTTTFELMAGLQTDLMLYGRALVAVLPDADAPSGWTMTRIPAAWVVDETTTNGFEPNAWLVNNPHTDSAPAWFKASDGLVEFRLYDALGPLGCAPPVEALKQVLNEQVSAWAFRNGIWKNGGWVNRYIERPANAPEWSNEARDRFAKSWKEKFSGKNGTDTGGTPILEDGMQLKDAGFNAREAQWVEATRLSREDVAAVYHINSALIWHTEAQTYASAKDNARALYAEALAPSIEFLQQRFNAKVLPMIGAPDGTYWEFDMQAKLQGSFEEQAQVLQTSVGAPYMTRNEARAKLNLPPVDGGDELVTPLNVLIGGQASPTDSDYSSLALSAEPATKSAPAEYKSSGRAEDADAKAISAAIAKFARRQSKRVLQELDKSEKCGACFTKADDDEWPEWWDGERWNRELAADLMPIFMAQATKRGRRSMRELGDDADEFSEERIEAYIAAVSKSKAQATNAVTLKQLIRALDGDIDEAAEGATPEGVFEKAATERADMQGVSFATAIAGWAALEACRQSSRRGRKMKRWITGANPRPTHAAMDGETVPYDEPFSNGAMYPGDRDLIPEESCGCNCNCEVIIR